MPSRRSMLAALGATLAGCNGSERARSTPTPSPEPTETPVPFPEEFSTAIRETRFDVHIACPGAVDCFHRYSRHDEPETVVVPDSELLTPDAPTVTTTTYNTSTEPLVLGTPTTVWKWTDIHWTPTFPPDVPDGTVVLDPGDSLERTFGIDERGDGTYAVVEEGYFGSPREPPTVDRSGEPVALRGETFRFGALFDVDGSEWAIELGDDVETTRDGETLVVEPGRDGDDELVLEAVDDVEGLPLVAETVAAHPPTKAMILGLARDGVERTRLSDDGTARWYIRNAQLFPRDLDTETTLRLDDLLFRLVET